MGFAEAAGASADEINKGVARAAEILALSRCSSLSRNCPADNASASRWTRHRARPQVFLFDEPLSNLDAKLRVAMRTKSRNCISG